MPPPSTRLALRARCVAHAALGLAACGGPAPAGSDRPRAEFLLSAGDSTYWVASGPAAVRVRASPMFLARYDGRLYEVYAADDDRSFYDALFTSQRIYRRDLVGGDSLPVFDDATVPALARRYAATHPHESPLGPDDEGAENPRTVASTEVSLLDVHGPYLTYDARADIDVDGGADQQSTRRAVVDLRTGRPATLADLFGAAPAGALVAEGRRALARALDSVRAIADTDDEAGARAVHALPSFRFVPENFGLAVDGERPAVVFVSLGRDVDGHVVTLSLPPVAVAGAAPAWWADEVRRTLPATSADSVEARWRLDGGAELVARHADATGAAALSLRAARPGREPEWPVARVAGPARQLFALDRPALEPAARRALARAFNESALYGGGATIASRRRDRDRGGDREPNRLTRFASGPTRGAPRALHDRR